MAEYAQLGSFQMAISPTCPWSTQEEVTHLSPLSKLPSQGGSGGVEKVLSLAYGTNELPFMMAASRTYHDGRAQVRGRRKGERAERVLSR